MNRWNRGFLGVVLCGVVLGLCGAGVDEEYGAEELAKLTELVGDEDLLVKAAREVDRREVAMYEWDMELAGEHAQQGEATLAREKADRAQRRIEFLNRVYQMVLGQYPRNARALTYYGELAYDYFNREGQGVSLWEEALDIDKDIGAAHNNLGIHYSHIGVYDRALRHFGEALRLEPDNADFLFNVAQIYLIHFPELQRRYDMNKKEVYREAMKLSRRAAKNAPLEYDILQDYAVNFFAGKDFDVSVNWRDAADAWTATRGRARNATERFYTWLNEARASLRGEYYDRANVCLKEALALYPESDVVKRLQERVRSLSSGGGKG